MASKLNRIGKDIMSAMKNATEQGTSAYDTTAEVRRIEGDIAWVHIAGGVDETPVKLTIAAKAGDSVQVRVGGGRAWITGNATAPPTDDRQANIATEKAETVEKKVSVVQKIADTAKKIAGNTTQYFWHTQEGTDTGVHITEKPQEEFLDDPANGGGNLLARSNGIAVRDGLDELAVFSANGAQIGLDTGAHTIIDEDGMQIFAEEVSGGSVVELANIGYGEGNTASGTGYAPYYSLGTRRRTSNVYDNTATYKVGDLVLYGDPQKTYVCVTDIATPEAWTQSHWKLAIGNYSLAEGFNTTASGQYSHAEGSGTVATGALSHAEGLGSIASGGGSHAGGFGSVASGQYSFAQGHKAKAIGQDSIALGYGAEATEIGSIALSGKLIFNGSPLADFVIEQGTSGSWKYRKWSNGRFEAILHSSAGSTGSMTQLGSSGIYYSAVSAVTFPTAIGITEVDYVSAVCSPPSNYFMKMITNRLSTSSVYIGYLRFGSGSAVSNVDYSVKVEGTWS